MTDPELDRLLRTVRVPDREPEFWQSFPGEVVSAARSAARAGAGRRHSFPGIAHPWRLVWVSAGLAALLFGALRPGRWPARRELIADAELAAARQVERELAVLFPGQIEAILFDSGGPRLVLNERPAAGGRLPVFLKVCGPAGCRSAVTYSGSRIRMEGEELEVLAQGTGEVLVLGRNFGWLSGEAAVRPGFRLAGRVLEAPL